MYVGIYMYMDYRQSILYNWLYLGDSEIYALWLKKRQFHYAWLYMGV